LYSTSPMNPRAGHRYIPLQKTLEATVEPNATTGANEQREAVVHMVGIEEPLQPTQSSYRIISTVRSAILLCSIIITNCFCSALICLCLWEFSKIDNLDPWQKRAFNTLSILLSAALSFGIGFLCDQVGFLAKGQFSRVHLTL